MAPALAARVIARRLRSQHSRPSQPHRRPGTPTPELDTGTAVLLEIQKTCANNTPENVSFTVSYHL